MQFAFGAVRRRSSSENWPFSTPLTGRVSLHHAAAICLALYRLSQWEWPPKSKISGFDTSNWSREVLGGVLEAYLSDHRRCPSFAACHRAFSMSTPSKVYDQRIDGLNDARPASAGPFYPGVQLGSTSMVHLRPILAMLRSFGLSCFS